jgi:hypothetical protein
VGESTEPRPDHGSKIVKKPKIGSTLNKKEALNIDDLPESALSAIKEIKPDFVASEAEKEFKHGNVYLDVEGALADGSEIEFDMLQEGNNWKVVEIQRDLKWQQLPKSVSTALLENTSDFTAKRIIESIQHGTNITVYEFYSVDTAGKEFRKEVKLENRVAMVLDEEWQH